MSTKLSDLLYAGFRIAGITGLDRPGRTPSTDQYSEGIPIINRMIGSWNCDRLKIFDTATNAYPLVAGQKTYTLGDVSVTPTNLSTTRPEAITAANIIINTSSPVIRREVEILTEQQWAAIAVQDVPGTIPTKLFADANFPVMSIYLWGQALTTYQLELYTWRALPTFSAITDAVILPPGYELAITYNLGRLFAAQFPTQARMSADALDIARESLAAIESVNAPSPIMRCDASVLGGRRGGRYNYLSNT